MLALSLAVLSLYVANAVQSPLVRREEGTQEAPTTIQALWDKSRQPPEAKAALHGFAHGGSGCPQSVNVTLSSDFYFPSFTASVGKNVSLTEIRHNCYIVVDISADPGWKYRVRGSADTLLRLGLKLEDGVQGTYKNTYSFSGDLGSGTVTKSFDGPFTKRTWVADPPEEFTSPFSPCGGGLLNFNRQVRLSGATNGDTSYIQFFDSRVNPILPFDLLEWAKCT